jgi:large subunit GTPase 1
VEQSSTHDEVAEEHITFSEEDRRPRTEDSIPEADTSSTCSGGSDDPIQSENEEESADSESQEGDYDDVGPRVKVLSVVELENLFVASAPDLSGKVSASCQRHSCSSIA